MIFFLYLDRMKFRLGLTKKKVFLRLGSTKKNEKTKNGEKKRPPQARSSVREKKQTADRYVPWHISVLGTLYR